MQCKWVYRTKVADYASDIKCKASLVSKLFSQFQAVDYTNTLSSVAKMDSIRLFSLSIVASKHWEVHHMDVNSDFIHGGLHEEIYMQHPNGYIHDPSLVCRLKKYLYCLKQAPRAWYAKMDKFLLSLGFERCKSDSNVYLQHAVNLF